MSTMLYLLVSVIAFAITAALGKWMIPFLHKLKFGQTIREVGPSWHKNKQGTPTMGGLMFILGIAIAMIVCLPIAYSLGLEETVLLKAKTFAGLGMAVAFGAIGFMDDYISILKKRNLGLTERQKLVLQFAVVAAYLASVAFAGGATHTTIPFVGQVDLGWLYYPLAAVVIVGVVNAVNFTDGIDGLNTTVSFFAFLSLALCAGLLSMTGLSAMGLASAAACIGFLIWNWHPAKVFMGDTGSLFLGGAVCGMAFALDMPLILVLVGIIYIVETMSDIIQVLYFKATHGKRIFRMAPLHHHLEMGGWKETKVVFVFAGISLVFCILAFFGVIGRYPVL